jgi:peptide/nickel transport system substrate-binding protein
MMYDNALPGASPLKDPRVRRALLMAIDRDAIAKALYKGYATTPVSAVPKITPGFNPAAKAVPYDPAGAKKLLADAGVGPFEITLSSYTTSTVPDLPKVAETIVPFWEAIGVKATLNNVEAATYLPQFRNKQLKGAALIAGPTFFYIEPVRLSATSFFWTKAPYTTVVDDATIDGIVDQLNVETDFDKRAAIGRKMADYLDEQLFGLPIVLTSSLIAVGPNVSSFGFIQSNPYAGPTSWILAK